MVYSPIIRSILMILTILTTSTVKAQYNSQSEWIKIRSLWEFAFHKAIYHRPIPERVLYFAKALNGTPYVGNTLDINPQQEQLVVNISQLDCVTFVENVLALSYLADTLPNLPTAFSKELQHIRYRNGIIQGYGSRLHYATAWLLEMSERKKLYDITATIGGIPFKPQVNYISQNVNHYPALIADTTQRIAIRQMEQILNSSVFYYIPKENISAQIDEKLKSGDIILITTIIKGLDTSHLGIAHKRNGIVYLIHASSKKKSVVETEIPLKQYLYEVKNQSGIIVARIRSK